MKSASTAARTEFILYDAIAGTRSHPLCTVEYQDDEGAWVEFDDITSVTVNKNSDDSRYGSFSLLPEISEVTVKFDNSRSRYSPGAGGEYSGILIRNRPIRVYMGYTIQENVSKTLPLDVDDYQKQLYHTQILSNKVYNSITNTGGSPTLPGLDFSLYGEYKYGGATYGEDGYYLTDLIDTSVNPTQILMTLSVTSDTNKIKLYYRAGQTRAKTEAESFTYVGTTINGTTNLDFPDTSRRFIQFAFVWETGVWSSTTGYITGLAINYTDTAEYFAQGVYLCDDPTFSSGTAEVTARDFLKRSYETNISLPSISGEDISTILRWTLDRAEIPYTNTTIPLLGHTVTIADDDNFKDAKARDVLDKIMSYIVGIIDEHYRLNFNDSGLAELVLVPDTATTSDYVIDYRSNMFSIDKGYSSNNLLQRMTLLAKEHTVEAETLLDTDSFNTTGSKTLSWANPAIYKRLAVDYGNSSSDATVTITEVKNTSLKATIYGTTIDIDLSVYGDELKTSYPFAGEWIVSANHVSSAKQDSLGIFRRDGFTSKKENQFIQSDAEAEAMAKAFGNQYGNRLFQLSVSTPGNPLLEINDKVMVFEKYTNSNSIFILKSISHTFEAFGCQFKSNFTFLDYGFILPQNSYIWDLAGFETGITDLDWDVGYLWDQDLGYISVDPNDYENTRPVRFS